MAESGGGGAFVVRPAALEDLAAIRALEIENPSAAHWPESAYLEIFSSGAPARIALVLEDESGSTCGFAIARLAGGDCELENIAVAPGSQRRGLGTLLLGSLIAAVRLRKAQSVFLEVRDSNAAARALYEGCGFSVTGRRAGYYSGPAEAAVLYGIRL